MMRTFRPVDIIIIILVLGCGIAALPHLKSGTARTVAVFRDSRKIAQYPLSTDRTVTLNGHIGPVTLSLSGGRVSIVSSSCPRQICVHSRAISRGGEQLICVPNHLVVEIALSAKQAKIDAIAR